MLMYVAIQGCGGLYRENPGWKWNVVSLELQRGCFFVNNIEL